MTAPVHLRDYACAKVRRRLDSYLSGELSVDLSHEILEHLERCPECRAEVEAREKLRAAFRRVAGAASDPREGFEGEVRALLSRTPVERAIPAGLLLAASLVLAAGATGWLVLSRASAPDVPGSQTASAVLDAPAADFAATNHQRCARGGEWPRRASSGEAFTDGLDSALGAAARAVAARLPEDAPVSAHLCATAGEKIFHVILHRRGDESPEGIISVVVTRPGSELALRAGAMTRLATARRLGYAVAGTRIEDGRLVFVVTSAGEGEALEMEKAVLPALATALARR